MSYMDDFCFHINNYFMVIDSSFNCVSNLHDSSFDSDKKVFVFDDENYNSMRVVSMDYICQKGYKVIKGAITKHLPNTVDAFLIDNSGFWYFIEFKNCAISKKNDNIEKKGINNLLMLIDILKHSGNKYNNFNVDPTLFIREKCIFIVVVPQNADPYTAGKVKDCDKISEKYTPEFLEKFKEFYFKDAYVYTVEYFLQRFVKKFVF